MRGQQNVKKKKKKFLTVKRFYIFECIRWSIKHLISLMHGVTMKITQISNFVTIRPVGACCAMRTDRHTDVRTDRHDEANSSSSQFWERA